MLTILRDEFDLTMALAGRFARENQQILGIRNQTVC